LVSVWAFSVPQPSSNAEVGAEQFLDGDNEETPAFLVVAPSSLWSAAPFWMAYYSSGDSIVIITVN